MVASNKKIIFVKPQVIKLRNIGKKYSEIVSMINAVNGENHQITENVILFL